jgi:membrane-associated protease RseP (regulator of RpoE activity)
MPVSNPDRRYATMTIALRLLLAVLAAAAAGDALAQPPNWMLDQPFMPHRGRIGVNVQPMTPALRKFFEVPADRGVLVSEVQPDRPADRAGVQVGDVVVSAGGDTIREPYDLVKSVARAQAEEKLVLEVFRDGEKQKLEVAPEGDPVRWADPEQWRQWLDRNLHEGGEQLRERLRELEDRLEKLERQLDRQTGTHNQPATGL